MSEKRQRVNQESESYKLRQKLNEWGRQLHRDSEDFAAQKSIKEKIWVLAFQIWSPYKENMSEQIGRGVRTETKHEKGKKLSDLEAEVRMDALIEVLNIVFQKFDPKREVPLAAFIQNYLKWKIADEKTKLDIGGKWVTDENNPDEMAWKPDIDIRSFDKPIGGSDGKDSTLGELIPDKSNQYVESEEQLKAMHGMLTLMLHVRKMIEQKAGDKRSKYIYEYLFFTNDVVNYCQLEEQPIYFLHEREMWDIMKEQFVDFCMEDFCRTFDAIQRSEMKTYRQIGRVDKSNADDRIAIPMPNTVGLEYLKQIEKRSVSAATYGEQSDKYQRSMWSIMRKKDFISNDRYNKWLKK